MAKRVLKDTKLNTIANKQFNLSIDKDDPAKFMVGNSILTDVMENQQNEQKMFEVEMLQHEDQDKTLLKGTTILPNRTVNKTCAEAITPVNMFKKLNFSQHTPNTIKVRRRGGSRLAAREAFFSEQIRVD